MGGVCVVACYSAVGADCGAQQGVCDGCDSQLCPDQGFYGVWRVNDDEVAAWVRAGCLAREPGDVRDFQGGRVCAVVQPECGTADVGFGARIFIWS